MKFIIGYKQQMTQKYRQDGTLVPVTVVKAEPAVVTQVKTNDKDGYTAVQLGFGSRKKHGKALAGHVKKILETGRKPFHGFREVRVEDASAFSVGDTVTVKTFGEGDKIAVTGTSKGRGFQGVVKRHGFGGSPASHGHKDQLRMPGSIGAGEPQHVFKGTRMGGRMGNDQITVKNLEVVAIDEAQNLLYIKGALPGARNSVVLIQGEGDVVLGGSIFEASQESTQAAEEAAEPVAQQSESAETQQEEQKAPAEENNVEQA